MRPTVFRAPLALALLTLAAGCASDGVGPNPPNPAEVPAGLWTASASSGSFLRLAPDELSGTGDRTPATVITTPGAQLIELVAVAFDPEDGVLWAASSADSELLAFSRQMLSGSGSRVPSKVITSVGGSLDGPTGLAFDPQHRLWVVNNRSGTVVRFDRDQLVGGGGKVPAVVLSLPGAPTAIAFDRAGNLWVSDITFSTVSLYLAAKLTTSGSPAEDLRLSAANALDHPGGIAVDAAGNLWVANLGNETVVAFTPAQVQGAGLPAPHVVLSSNQGSLAVPAGLAFDRDGALWVVGGAGTLTRFEPASLVESGAPEPSARLHMAGHTALWSGAFWPIPAGLPLQ